MSNCPGALGLFGSPSESKTFSFKNFSKSSLEVPPARRITMFLPVTSMMVDSTPTLQFPPSIIASILPYMSLITCCARVGLGLPDRFELGAAIGTFAAFISARANGCFGIRTATVLSPAVILSPILGFYFKMIVSGPGENSENNLIASFGISVATLGKSSMLFM